MLLEHRKIRDKSGILAALKNRLKALLGAACRNKGLILNEAFITICQLPVRHIIEEKGESRMGFLMNNAIL